MQPGADVPIRFSHVRQLPGRTRLVEIDYAPDWEFPEHEHPQACVSLVLGGAFREDYRAQRRELRAGSVVVYAERSSHSGNITSAGAKVFQLELGTSPLTEGRSGKSRQTAQDDSAQTAGLVPGLARQLYLESLEAPPDDELVLSSLACELAAAVGGGSFSEGARAEPPRWLSRVIELLRESLDQPVTLGELAREAGLHPSHFAREFRRRKGTSVGDFRRRLRVALAADYLSETSRPPAEIAHELGYSDQSHLGRQFKRFMEMTPAQYRARGAHDTIRRPDALL